VRFVVFGALLWVLLLVAAGVLWVGNLRFAGQPSLFERPFLPRTAMVGSLVVKAPPGYGIHAEGGKPDGSGALRMNRSARA
jgi:hypothetical protein